MYRIEIFRDYQDSNQSLSTVKVLDEQNRVRFASVGLERGWRGNQNNVSCIPQGKYEVLLEWSPKFKSNLWEIKNVPNRSECKFHASNYWHQLNGCIALGRRPKYLDRDEYLDVTSSKDTMKDFHLALKGQVKALLIINTRKGLN